MVETRSSSASSKRQRPSPPSDAVHPNPKRAKVVEEVSGKEVLQNTKEGSPLVPDQTGQKGDAAAPMEAGAGAVAEAVVEKSGDDGMDRSDAACAPPPPPSSQEEVQKKLMNIVVPFGMRKRVGKSNERTPWGKLISENPENQHRLICSSTFTVGRGSKCNLQLKDSSVSTTLCKLRRCEQGGLLNGLLEKSGGKGAIHVNGKTIEKRSHVVLRGGDEVIFSSSGNHAYIFQLLTHERLRMSSFNLPEAQSSPVKGIQFETRSRDPSAVAGASILASLSNIRKEDVTVLPSQSPNGEDVQQGSERLLQPPCDAEDICVPEVDVSRNAGEEAPGHAAHLREKTVVNLSSDHPGSSTSDLDLSGSGKLFKGLEERRELESPVPLPSSRFQVFKDKLKEGILRESDIDISFDNFPYYLSETTKNILLSSAYIHLKRKEFTKYTLEIASASQRVLLSGPMGSEIYQETLVKALAKQFSANLIIIDSLSLPGVSSLKLYYLRVYFTVMFLSYHFQILSEV